MCLLLLVVSVPLQSFSQLATGHVKFLGNVHSGGPPAPSFDTYWNQVSPENAGKWGSVEGSRDVYSWSGLDQAYNYALGRGIPYRHHCLVWGQQQPSWITSLDSASQAEEVEEWIRLVGERYPRIDFVDVVNEPLPGHNPAQYRNALGGSGATGWDWVIWTFQKARQYLPHAKLTLNEFNILNDASNTTQLLVIVNLLKDRGLIDAIGIQGHRFELENTPVSTLQSNLDRLGATGVPIYLTEFDLGNIGNTGTPNDAQQLQLYQRIFPVLWEHPAVKGITLWGYIEGQIWQSTAFLVRSNGGERPALQWLRQYLSKGNYRSAQSGNWNDASSWERFNDSTWVPASNAPTLSDQAITIGSGHTITVTADDSSDQVLVASGGTLVIGPGVAFRVKDGNGVDLTVKGRVANFGSLTKADSAEIGFFTGGTYAHEQDGGSIPTATWGGGSICQFDSVKTSAPSNGNQNFYSVVWNCPGHTGNLNLGWNGNTIGGNITVVSTGSGRWQMCAPPAGTSSAHSVATVTINGSINQSGGQFTSNGTSNNYTDITINTMGNVAVTGGNFSVSRGSQGGTGTTTWNLYGDFSMSNATTQNSNSAGAKFVFAKPGVQPLALGAGNTLTSLPIEVSDSTTLSMGSSVLSGSGVFTLKPGATVQTALAGGLDSAIMVTGTKTLSEAAGYGFTGSAAQVTGSLLPDTVASLAINNVAGVTLSHSVNVNGTVDMKAGALSLGGNLLNYGPNATLKYSATVAQTTADAEFPQSGGPPNLAVANRAGVTLHASRTIPGNLELSPPSSRITLGANTLTVTSTSNASPSRYVVTGGGGALRHPSVGSTQTFFPVGSGGYAPVWVTNSGAVDPISVSVSPDADPAPYGGRVKVRWNITEEVVGGGTYTLQFGWTSSLMDAAFASDMPNSARIFSLVDTTEAGTGNYTTQFATQPYSVARGGIAALGPFAVGRFSNTTGVEEASNGVPTEFLLRQNYPNPFNPSTIIRYSVPVSSIVKVTIYNTLGMKVRSLVNTVQDAGNYSVTWDGKDEHNGHVSSGVYFYRLETRAGNLLRKMTLVR